MSKERPILFSAPMVRAILEGRKTQTRRVVKLNQAGRAQHSGLQWHPEDPEVWRACPYGVPGDLLWVRETWALNPIRDFGVTKPRSPVDCVYRAGYATTPSIQWTPSIHMPRAASRITLKVTDVRVERLQEISNDDCEAEGIKQRWTCINPGTGSYAHDNDVRDDYRKLWTDINGKDSWAANPWVWVVSFEKQP